MLRDEDVTSKAMRRKLARAAGAPAGAGSALVAPDAEPALPPAALPGQPQQQQQPSGGGGVLSYLLSNFMMGMGITLGFIAVAAAFRALTGAGAPRGAAQRPLLERPAAGEARGDPYDTASRRPGSETRI